MIQHQHLTKLLLVLLYSFCSTESLARNQVENLFVTITGDYHQIPMRDLENHTSIMGDFGNLLAQNEYSAKSLTIVSQPDNYAEAQIRVEKIFSAYESNDIDLAKFNVWLGRERKYCLNDAYFMKASKGMAIVFSYYYLLRLDFLGQPYSRFAYAAHQELEFKDMLMDMSSAQIIKYFGQYVHRVNDDDREEIYAFLRELDEAHERFAKQVNRRVIGSLNEKKLLNALDFYDLGFPAHKNNCFTDAITLSHAVVKVKGYSSYAVHWDLFLYSFWLRRYNDRTIGLVNKLLDFALWSMER